MANKCVKEREMKRERNYIYREGENSEIIAKSKPREIGRKEIIMRWEVVKRIRRGRRWKRRRIERMLNRNKEIMGLFYEEKGVRRRRSRKIGRGLGRKRENSMDTRLEYREMRFFTKRGVRTRRVWLSEEPLPLPIGLKGVGKEKRLEILSKGRSNEMNIKYFKRKR